MATDISCRVLRVEDHPGLLRLLSTPLTAVESSGQALWCKSAIATAPDDLRPLMSGMDGMSLFNQVHSCNPSQPVQYL